MEIKFLLNERKMIVASFCAVIFAALTIFLAVWRTWLPALLCLILCVIYCVVAVQNGRVMRISASGISCRSLFREHSVNWEDIREIGVVGLRVLNRAETKHKGSRNIYFSEKTLSDDELFDLCLNWPPKDMLHCRFTFNRIAKIQKIWTQDVRMYNVGDLHF